jgi:A/G-specific adenine glycosylase
VSRVYASFFEAYPRIEDLAKADRRTVGALLKPLGIESRVSDLIGLAQHIEREEGCRIPDDYSKLTALQGVGKYIANSVLVKGYGKHLPLVDSNVNRVIARVLTGENRIRSEIAETVFMGLVRSSSPVELNYAVIDLAHAICTHRNPECMICPINSWCRYAHSSDSSRLIKKGRPFLLSHQRRCSIT